MKGRTFDIINGFDVWNLLPQDFVPGVLKQHNLESGSRIIIPVPNEIGGVVVVGEVSVMYIGLNIFKAVPTYRSMIRVRSRLPALLQQHS